MQAGLELYDLENDISENTDVSEQYPDIVAQMLVLADTCRAELGDALTEMTGRGNREPGRIVVEGL
jgi:arylsulfatase A